MVKLIAFHFLSALFSRLSFLFFIAIFLLNSTSHAQELKLSCKSAALIDYYTGQVLYSKSERTELSPASLTKLVTMDLVFEGLKRGDFNLKTKVPISKNAWRPYLPKGSSLMFLAPGHRVTVHELLLGVAVCSGNDAAVALSEFISGSENSFVIEMNNQMKALNFKTLSFSDASGLDRNNKITALEFAQFIKGYLQRNQKAVIDYHSVGQMTYPKRHNLTAGQFAPSIHQKNRNSLLKSYKGLDGLKTGYIKQSGYNIALTAIREDTRLIAVVLGSSGRNINEGTINRNRDGQLLLDYGFNFFKTITTAKLLLTSQKVWYGNKSQVQGYIAEEPKITIARHQTQYLRSEANYRELRAPLKKDEIIGLLVYYIGLTKIVEYPIYAAEEIRRGVFIKRVFDSCVRWFSLLFK